MANATVSIAMIVGAEIVRLRAPIALADEAASAMNLPTTPLTCTQGDPVALWLAPDQWLLISRTRAAADLLSDCRNRLGGILYHAVDTSDALECVSVSGPSARAVLGMLSGVDFSQAAFPTLRCVGTRLAKVAAIIRATDRDQFELLVDRSLRQDLIRHLEHASRDALLQRQQRNRVPNL